MRGVGCAALLLLLMLMVSYGASEDVLTVSGVSTTAVKDEVRSTAQGHQSCSGHTLIQLASLAAAVHPCRPPYALHKRSRSPWCFCAAAGFDM